MCAITKKSPKRKAPYNILVMRIVDISAASSGKIVIPNFLEGGSLCRRRT